MHALHEKIREADLLPGSLDIFLHFSPVLSEGECPVKRRLFARADRRVVGRAEKVGNGVALRLGVRHHFVLHALVSVVAPRLQNATTHQKLRGSHRTLGVKQCIICICMNDADDPTNYCYIVGKLGLYNLSFWIMAITL